MIRILAGAAWLAASVCAYSQTWPVKPIRNVLTLAGTDFLARSVATKMSEALGQPVVIDLVVGASGSIGAATVARAAPDGYTIMLTSSAQIVTRPFLSRNTPYDSVKSFTPIAKVAEAVAVVVVNPKFPAATMKDLVDYAKRNPGKVSYATSGVGTTHHLSAEVVRQLAGLEWTHVPYKASSQAVTDILTGEVPVAFGAFTNFVQFANSGKLRVVAINNEARFKPMPDVPTVAEQLLGYERPQGWVAYFGPAGMPVPLVMRLHDEIVRALAPADVRAKLESTGMMVGVSTPAELAEMVKRTVAITGRMVKAAGIEPE
jgi:tripartite-type tricarboxylate transporter receptor subunit TctC